MTYGNYYNSPPLAGQGVYGRGSVPESIVAYNYKITPEDASLQVLTAADLRAKLIIDAEDLPDAQADELILTAQQWAELYCGFTLFTSEYDTWANGFPSIAFQLNIWPVKPVSENLGAFIEYLVDGAFVPVDQTIYSLANRSYHTMLYLNAGCTWPTDGDMQLDSVKINGLVGFGIAPTDIPLPIKMGVCALAVWMYQNPGDCDSCSGSAGWIPSTAARYLKMYKPLNV